MQLTTFLFSDLAAHYGIITPLYDFPKVSFSPLSYIVGFMPSGFSPLSSPVKGSPRGGRGEPVYGSNIPMITELGL